MMKNLWEIGSPFICRFCSFISHFLALLDNEMIGVAVDSSVIRCPAIVHLRLVLVLIFVCHLCNEIFNAIFARNQVCVMSDFRARAHLEKACSN